MPRQKDIIETIRNENELLRLNLSGESIDAQKTGSSTTALDIQR
jgi:hypothetical protein